MLTGGLTKKAVTGSALLSFYQVWNQRAKKGSPTANS
jgi:hypothetical protein